MKMLLLLQFVRIFKYINNCKAHRKGPRSFLGLNNYEQLLLLVVDYIIKIGILVKQKKQFLLILMLLIFVPAVVISQLLW